MAPQVKKVKTAFLFFQGDKLAKIRAELGPTATMGEAMTELSNRWKNMSDAERKPYLDQEAADRERYAREAAEADAQAMVVQEARRAALAVQEGEGHSSRGARQRIDAERRAKEELRERRRQSRENHADDEDVLERKRQKELQKKETEERRRKRQEEEDAVAREHKKLDKEEAKKAAQRLEYLLKQSSIFSRLQGVAAAGQASGVDTKDNNNSKKRRATANGGSGASKKNGVHHIHGDKSNEESPNDDEDVENDGENLVFLTQQPSCIKFGKLKPYQIESLNWMIHLAEKGLNGILADEMGLGKTLQSISILAYFWEYQRIQGPHLICVPKSTLSNWMNELKRWCPSLRAIKFHGVREEREALIEQMFSNEAAAHDGRRPDKQIMDENGEMVDDNSDNPRQWDVCVTTYEVANTEKKHLQKFAWKYLIIDEAHRLKNDASMFSKTVRSFRTANRLLLTGTPLQNNLHELWALLNFLLPDIFASAEQFDEWFDLEIDDEEAKKTIISQLHKILRPFMLRRLKVDVAKGLPPKTETILMVGMSSMQKKLYKKLLLRDLDSFTGKAAGKNRTAILNIVMQLRKCCGHPYLFEGVEDRTLDPLGEHLVENCGKLSMVDKLLKRLKERGSRVLIFTQMTRVLDILEDFMVMRGYKYCRIDGNTNYEDRENAIDEFNRPGSEKFCFILSTRAGGLGINLQTADTCILYDSDWNPQQDLQAQDRCHRLGQKKPVSVFRLVSENTVEEKIVERAQQKLKLDAMVVQQGRLKDADKVSKEEIMAAVRFGADTVFRSEESTITDEDIDVILERGAAKTKELQDKLQKADKGDLLDFRLDGGLSAQTFEGIDYSDKDVRDHLRMLAADSMGKRERRPPPTGYNPIIHSKKSMVVNNTRIKLPKCLRIPQMEDHHFYNRERLLELGKLEFETYAALRELGQLPPMEVMERQRTLLPSELGREKLELLAEGFGDWSRSRYYNFLKACAKFGRDDIASIAADMDLPEETVRPYSKAFWQYGPTELKTEWDRIIANIERGEKKLAKQKKLSSLLTQFVSTFDNPRDEMVFANKGTTHFALEQDRALLFAVNKHGYGNWDSVREEIRQDIRLKFQHLVQGMTVQSIGKRCDYRMRQMEKELEAREKTLKNKRPPTLLTAQKALDAIKEMDAWDATAREAQLSGQEMPPLFNLSNEAQQIMEDRLKERSTGILRLREIEVQVQRCLALADETRQAIYRGDQYVNYSTITLKAGGPGANKDDKSAKSFQEAVELEARINKEILKTPACRLCESCTTSNTKLCVKRLEVRNKLLGKEVKQEIIPLPPPEIDPEPEKAKAKKRKAEPPKPVVVTKPKKKATPSNPVSVASSATKPVVQPPAKKKKPTTPPPPPPPVQQTKRRVVPQGNKKMSIPEELFPEFCRRISAAGTGERMNLINKFVEDNPGVSARQVIARMSEVTTRDRPECIPPPEKKGGRSFIFYLRPCFYKYLPEEERPDEWEKYAELDQAKYEEDMRNRRKKGGTSVASSVDENGARSGHADAGSHESSASTDEEDHGEQHNGRGGDETEEESDDEPSWKRVKLS